MIIKVRACTRASKNQIVYDQALTLWKVYTSSPPVDGKANASIIELLSKYFKRPKTSIEIVQGLQHKDKLIKIKGWEEEDILPFLPKTLF